jgi:hypothetical protein
MVSLFAKAVTNTTTANARLFAAFAIIDPNFPLPRHNKGQEANPQHDLAPLQAEFKVENDLTLPRTASDQLLRSLHLSKKTTNKAPKEEVSRSSERRKQREGDYGDRR